MNIRTSYVLIAIIAAVGTMTASSAFAQQEACPNCGEGDVYVKENLALQNKLPVSVWTDRSTYDHESTIMVNGAVAHIRSGVPVTLMVISPSNNVVTINQLDVDSDGKFGTSLSTAGNLWKYDGTYTIRVQYGSQEVNNKALVELTGGIVTVEPTPDVTCNSDEVDATGTCVSYSISGGSVTGASLSSESNSLIVMISADNDDGTLTVDPSSDAIRGIFMVLVDDQEWDDVVIDGNSVTVMFPAGTETIEIIGTFAIPEFGAITAMILAVTITAIIAVSARSRLSIIPKF